MIGNSRAHVVGSIHLIIFQILTLSDKSSEKLRTADYANRDQARKEVWQIIYFDKWLYGLHKGGCMKTVSQNALHKFASELIWISNSDLGGLKYD